MLNSFRPGLLVVAALSATYMVPAQAGPSGETLLPMASANLPQVAVPELLDPEGEPQLSEPQTDSAVPGVSDETTPEATPAVKPTGELSDLVAQLRDAAAGTRDLECLATGIYFESKSEPLAGQLAVGQVIANRAQSGGGFPSSYCGVLFQRSQFSFVRGHSLPSVPRASKQWQTAVAMAKIV